MPIRKNRITKEGDLRVWFIPEVGTSGTFYQFVDSLEEAAKVLTALAEFDLFLEKEGLRRIGGNVGGVEVFGADGDFTWSEWNSPEYDSFDEWVEANYPNGVEAGK